MIILQDSQIKKIFHNGDEVKKILDWDGNVIFYKQSGGGGVMTNDIKFHTTSAVTSSNVFTVTYTVQHKILCHILNQIRNILFQYLLARLLIKLTLTIKWLMR